MQPAADVLGTTCWARNSETSRREDGAKTGSLGLAGALSVRRSLWDSREALSIRQGLWGSWGALSVRRVSRAHCEP